MATNVIPVQTGIQYSPSESGELALMDSRFAGIFLDSCFCRNDCEEVDGNITLSQVHNPL